MKKLILSVTAVGAISMGAFAQGTIAFDGSNNSNPSPSATSEGYVFINSVLDTSQDINAELLYSTTGTAGTFSPVVTLLLTSSASPSGPQAGQVIGAAGDITTIGSGQLYDLSGQTYNVPGTTTSAYFEVEGWLGTSSTYAGAITKGTSLVWQDTTLGAQGTPVTSDVEGMSALNLVTTVPEPSTFAMAGVGLASMLIFRRRK